jgi:hypothetical protein
MKSYVTFRRRPLDRVVPQTNEDRRVTEVVPYGYFGAGLWTGHPIGFVIVLGMLVVGLIGIPMWRWFFGATVLLAIPVAYFLLRRHNHL